MARLLFQLPSTCRIFVAVDPANQWGWSEALLNKANYALEVLAWQNQNEGVSEGQQSEKPELYKPDFMARKNPDEELEQHDTDDVRDLLSRPRV